MAANQQKLDDFAAEFKEAQESWRSAIMAGSGAAVAQTRVDDVLRRWRAFVNGLERQTEAAIAQDGVMTRLSDMLTEAEEQRAVLARLQSEAGTRADQADSLNPKVRASPYTNIMWLQRTFRSSTRTAILIASVVFAVLAVAALGFLVWRVMSGGELVRPGAMVGGAAATAKKVRFADGV
jgi:hypothetical protein